MSIDFSESELATLDAFKSQGGLWGFGGCRAMSFNARATISLTFSFFSDMS